ncbi:hypothetical protein D0C36_16280 [Mucilaginibacter conchicola]|uniref:Multi-ubiquitin domain-containing protein n=1 Tax=Mucilaginibacter conchicola TaxID=2303333 RepID=A0A372NUQ9_9SPHI|nr:multiubiquitin domain-containing protein [Mucilaginibacter conchicola]RFZ92945.1 hypothetical protein D0C36_16280 [Mucilaginibacter conchicola]
MELKKDGHEKPKVYIATVNATEIAVYDPKITGAQLLKEAGIKHVQCHTLYQKFKGCDFEKVAMGEVIDLSKEDIEHFVTKGPDVFNYEVDGEPETTDHKDLTPLRIMELKGADPANHYLIQLLHGREQVSYAYCPDEPIIMDCRGMKFITAKWLDVVNIEEYGKQCKPVPPARKYRIRVDKQYHDWADRLISVRELINLEYPHSSAPFEVYKFLNTSPKPVKLHHSEKVDLTEKCLVRFTIQPKEQKDGLQTVAAEAAHKVQPRREFYLPEDDTDFLDSLGLLWEAIGRQSAMWLLIHDYPLPDGYNVAKVDVALLIAPSYPATEIDMAYFYPALSKRSGRPINALSSQIVDGRNFQRWSRHRQPGEWRPGVDSISTHLCLVDNWLVTDLGR